MNINIPSKTLETFCQKWSITELSLFGSVLRDDFNPQSDVDVLVSFSMDATPTLFDLARMQQELVDIFGRKVDLVSKRGISASKNYIRRDAILNSAKVIYAA